MSSGTVDNCVLCFRELLSIENNFSLHIEGANNTKVRLLQSKGLPYNYAKSTLYSYPTIPYGDGYSVLEAPDLSHLPPLTFLTLMLSRTCEESFRIKVRSKTRSSQHTQGFHIVFVTGKSLSRCDEQIHNENMQFHDILQLDHIDAYHNLTLSVLYSLHYIHNLSLPIQYVLKTDSDCVVNYRFLHKLVNEIPPSSRNRVYMGNCKRNTQYNVYDASKKNFIPISLAKNEMWYSYYVTGGGYVISYSLLPQLLVGVSHLKFIGHFEDVNVGRAMELVRIKCIDRSKVWISRHGCPDRQSCLKHVVMHPKYEKDEIDRYYSYLVFFVCLSLSFYNLIAFLHYC